MNITVTELNNPFFTYGCSYVFFKPWYLAGHIFTASRLNGLRQLCI